MKAGAEYINSKAGGGGLAGRKLVVDFTDSHLNANDSRNATITACQNDLAMVGGAALFLSSVADITELQGPGRPARPVSPTSARSSPAYPRPCAPTSFPAIGAAIDCATVTQNPQTFYGNAGPDKWLLSQEQGRPARPDGHRE